MLNSTIHIQVDTDDIFSELTQETGKAFTVSQEELHSDGIVSFIIDLPKDVPDVVSRLETDPLVQEVRPLTGSKLLVKKESAGAIPTILQNGGMLHGVDTVYGNERVFNILVFHRDHLDTILDELGETVGTAELLKITSSPTDEPLLSPRQEEVVREAFELGYFDWPRKTDAQDLADHLDISHATMLEHLRKGEKKLLKWFLQESNRHNSPTHDQLMFPVDS